MPTTDPFTATVGFNASITLSSAGGRQVSAGISGTIYASTSYYTIQTG